MIAASEGFGVSDSGVYMKNRASARQITGGDDNDVLIGTRAGDVIDGSAGDDVIFGGRGQDHLTGGEGADTFVFSGGDTGDATLGDADVITDFGAGDLIDLSDANILYFYGFDYPEPLRGGMTIWQTGGDTYISWKAGGGYHDIVLAGYDGDIYRLLSQIVWFEDDYAGSTATTGTVADGGSVAGEIQDYTDQDWFRIDLADGRLYTFDIMGEADGGGTAVDPYVILYDADGNYVTEGYEALQFAVEAPGTYYLAAAAYDLGTYTLEVSSVAYEDDYGDGPDTGDEIAAGETITGDIGIPYDQDWLRIDLEAGQLYAFTLSGEAGGGGTLADPYLMLLDADGYFLTDGIELLEYVAEADATCFIAVASYGGTGTYTLGVAAEPYADDHGDTAATAGAIAAGETAAGRIGTPGDADWFAITLAAGETYTIDLGGSTSGSGSLVDPYLVLYDDAGNVLAENDDGDTLDSKIVYTATEDATCYISAQGLGSSTGTYQLSVGDLLLAA